MARVVLGACLGEDVRTGLRTGFGWLVCPPVPLFGIMLGGGLLGRGCLLGVFGIMLGVFAGCESAFYGTSPPPDTSSRIDSAPPQQGIRNRRIRIAHGDTLYAIARRHDVSIAELARVNRLSPPYTLRIGQKLWLPRKIFYTVRRKDTLFGIASRFSLSQTRIARLNQLDDEGYIRVGQKLLLPQTINTKGIKSQALTSSSTRPPPLGKAPPLKKPQTPAKPIAQSRGKDEALPPVRTRPSIKRGAKTGGKMVGKKTDPADASYDTDSVTSSVTFKGASSGSHHFSWPVRGRILSSFGRKKTGVHNDGINILAKRGTPVRAVSPGHVVYVGEDLAGLGKLLLIRHNQRWTSAYAHNEKVEVRRGQKVRRGQIIARVGASGKVQRAQLHFQLRRHAQPVNPHTYLEPPRG